MAILPDITAIDVGSQTNINRDTFLEAMKDYFDPTITSASGSAAIDSIRQENRSSTGATEGPAESPNFELVNNTNDARNFTITPKASGENWHVSLGESQSNSSYINALIDPQGNISNAITEPPTVDSTGNPDESSYEKALVLNNPPGDGDNMSTSFYIVEFEDAFYYLSINKSEEEIDQISHVGKIFQPLFPSFGSGYGYATTNEGRPNPMFTGGNNDFRAFQFIPSEWVTQNNYTFRNTGSGNNGGLVGEESIKVSLYLVVVFPNGERIMGHTKYAFEYSGEPETSGITLDGGSKTDFVFVADGINTTTSEIIPWDITLTPIFK